jgi:hypothetical protein
MEEDSQSSLDRLFFGLFRFVGGVVCNQNIAVGINAFHFFLARERTTSFCSKVLIALNETVSPDFVVNWMVVGFATTLVATNLMFPCAIKFMISPWQNRKATLDFNLYL